MFSRPKQISGLKVNINGVLEKFCSRLCNCCLTFHWTKEEGKSFYLESSMSGDHFDLSPHLEEVLVSASETLNRAERNYSVTEKERLGLSFGLYRNGNSILNQNSSQSSPIIRPRNGFSRQPRQPIVWLDGHHDYNRLTSLWNSGQESWMALLMLSHGFLLLLDAACTPRKQSKISIFH